MQKKNTPCKHILYIMTKVFNVKESLIKPNLINCCVSKKSKSNQMTDMTMLETTSTVNSLHVPLQNQAYLIENLPS